MYAARKLGVVKSEVEQRSFCLRRRHPLHEKLHASVAAERTAAPVTGRHRTTLLLFITSRTQTAERFVQFALQTSARQLVVHVAGLQYLRTEECDRRPLRGSSSP